MVLARFVCSIALPVSPTGKNTLVSRWAHDACCRHERLFQVASTIERCGWLDIGWLDIGPPFAMMGEEARADAALDVKAMGVT